MKIAYTSDIHGDITPQNRALLPYLAAQVERLAPDAFVIAGDFANSLRGWREALLPFQSLPIPKLIVPGNHDIWIESLSALRRSQDSDWKYRVALPGIARDLGFHYLSGAPMVINGVGFAGSLGWYDYSLRDPRLEGVYSAENYDQGEFFDPRFRKGTWNDVKRAAWLKFPNSKNWHARRLKLSTSGVFEKIITGLEQDLQAVSNRVSRLVAVLHTNPFPQCLLPKDCPDPFDEYEGSDRLGQILCAWARDREIVCICGHRHRFLDITVRGVRTVRSPVGYLEEFKGDLAAKAAESVGLIEF
jgi:hypothetical protein